MVTNIECFQFLMCMNGSHVLYDLACTISLSLLGGNSKISLEDLLGKYKHKIKCNGPNGQATYRLLK